jgi:peptide-methionine (S)-S-oxide reductase
MKGAGVGIGMLTAGVAAALAFAVGAGGRGPGDDTAPRDDRGAAPAEAPAEQEDARMKTATFGGGCFWCTEAVFEELKGVAKVVSGYAGGHLPDPTYQQVCTGGTGHAEVVQVTYDPEVVTFPELLEVFWKTHDPTTPNRQGHDIGTQYRSIILYADEDQKREAEAYKARLDESGAFEKPIVTEIVPLEAFYPAEAYHQDYYKNNPGQGYCQFVIAPKMDKFRKVFPKKLKES